MQDAAFPFAEFYNFPVCLLLWLIGVPLNGSTTIDLSPTPPSFMPSVDLLKMYSVLSSGSLMRILNSISCGGDPWGTPLLGVHQLQFTSLITTL